MQRTKNHCTACDLCWRYCNSYRLKYEGKPAPETHTHLLPSLSIPEKRKSNNIAIIIFVYVLIKIKRLSIRMTLSLALDLLPVHINRNWFSFDVPLSNFQFCSTKRMVSPKLNHPPSHSLYPSEIRWNFLGFAVFSLNHENYSMSLIIR